MPEADVLVTLPPFLRMKSASSFILISIPDGIEVNVSEPLSGFKRIFFPLLLSASSGLVIGSF